MSIRKFPPIEYVRDREAFIETICSGKVVLHLGCADSLHMNEHLILGRHLHIRLANVALQLYDGVDHDGEAIAALQELGFKNLYVADVSCVRYCV